MLSIQNELRVLLQQCCNELEDPNQALETLEAKHQNLLDRFFKRNNISDTAQQQDMLRQVISDLEAE